MASQSLPLSLSTTALPQHTENYFIEEFSDRNDEENEIEKRLAFIAHENQDNFNKFSETEPIQKPFPFATITVSQLRNEDRSTNRDFIPFKPRLLRLSPLNAHPSSDTNSPNSRNTNRRVLSRANKLALKQALTSNLNISSAKIASGRGKLSKSRFPNRRTELFSNRQPSVNRRISSLMSERLQELSNGRDTGQNKETKIIHIVKKVSPISQRLVNTQISNVPKINPVRILVETTTPPISISERTIVHPVPTRIVLRNQPSQEKRMNSFRNASVLFSPLKSSKVAPVLLDIPTGKILTSRRIEDIAFPSPIADHTSDTLNIRRIRINNPSSADDNHKIFKADSNVVDSEPQQILNVQTSSRNGFTNNANFQKNHFSEKEESNAISKTKLKDENNLFKNSPHSPAIKNSKNVLRGSITQPHSLPSSQNESQVISDLKTKSQLNKLSSNKNLSTQSTSSSELITKPSPATITFSQLRSSLQLTNSSDVPINVAISNILSTNTRSNDNIANTSRSFIFPTTFKPASNAKSPESLETNLMPSNSSHETGLDRGSSRTKPKTPTGTPTSGGTPQLVGRTPQRLIRPSKKPTPASSRSSLITDIWNYPPRRPNPLYPTPQVDLPAAPCDPAICKLPDCYCGGRAIPGNIAPQNVPQMVLLTFDDSVNDLNKKLYVDLFEKGRLNPNGCPISATFYISHEWTDYSQVQNLYSDGHEIASHSVTHSFGEQFSTKKWAKEIGGQREIMSAYAGVRMDDIRGMRAPFLAVGGNNMFRMLYDLNFTYDSSMPVYENNPPSWPYTLDYKIFHDCMIPPCPTNSYPGVWQVPMVMWQDLTGGRCSMGDACTTPPDAEGVYKMLIKNFERHYTTNRSPFGLFYHAAWFTTPHHKEGFIAFLDTISAMDDVWLVTNWQALQWVRDPTPLSSSKSFPPFQCDFSDRPPRCTTPKVCNVWHKGSVRYLKTCQTCPESYPWTGNTGVQSPLNDI